MKDNLQDLIEHTFGLGCIELIKITGTATATQINAMADDRTVIVSGEFSQPMAEFIGTFGMPNLGKLKTILGFDVYRENSKITVTRQQRNNAEVPVAIHFENSAGDFVNDYRLMSQAIVEEKVKQVSFKGTSWNVDFVPTVEGIRRLKLQAAANSEESLFSTKVTNNNLVVHFGDPSSHSGNFVFHSALTGANSTKELQWPVKQVLAILDLTGDKRMRISDQGAAEITVDTGIASYQFLLPAQTK